MIVCTQTLCTLLGYLSYCRVHVLVVLCPVLVIRVVQSTCRVVLGAWCLSVPVIQTAVAAGHTWLTCTSTCQLAGRKSN